MTEFDGVGVPDFVLLDQLTIEAFLDNLRMRFRGGKIYTYIGEVVVSVNPYRNMDAIYDSDVVAKFRGREIYENEPHVFALADAAYRSTKRLGKDSCIVISGKGSHLPANSGCTVVTQVRVELVRQRHPRSS